MNIDFTLWPNPDGELGTNKVTIPTGIGDDTWPDGDALINNVIYKDGKISGFVDTKALSVNESKSTVINYDYFDIELPFTEGEIAITRGPRSKYFNVRYNPINDDNAIITLKYKDCISVDDVIAIDPDYLTNDIVDGVWSEGLGDLIQGNYFVITGTGEEIQEDRYGMFQNCDNLTTFTSDLSSLENGNYMFADCYQLTSFSADLSSLTDGINMFYNCKLNTQSIKNIADTINTYNGPIEISIGNITPNEQEEEAFNKMVAKGWIVFVNGSEYTPTSPAAITTLDENDEERITPIPFYSKPVPATKKTANYVDSEGNFFNIVGAQFIYGDDLSTYGMFICEEDAATNMGLTKIEKKKLKTS